MEGLIDNWSLPTAEAKADFRNLPYGTFTFRVRAIGAVQMWSEPFEYTFTINPPWWHTWWARTGYGITALLLISLITLSFQAQKAARINPATSIKYE